VIPFAFPKSRHFRRLRPGPFTRYQAYKPHLRDEFENKCVYCRMPDTLKGYESFGVDHYKPKTKFPALTTVYSNLFYCCNPCNSRKGSYWPPPNRLKTHFIPNPCDHELFAHLRFVEERVEAKTKAGENAIALLDLNDPEVIAARRLILDGIKLFEAKRTETVEVLAQLRSKVSATLNQKLDGAILTLESELIRIEANLARLEGR